MAAMRPPATARDRTLTIGAASSVAFMSLSIAGAVALINLSGPARSNVPGIAALPAPRLEPLEVPPLAAAPASPAVAAPDPSVAAVLPAATVSQPAPPATRPAPPVAPRPVAAPPVARRPARHEGAGEHVAVAAVQPRAETRPPAAAPPRVARRDAPVPGQITPSSLRGLSAALNLTAEQRALYQPLERALLAISIEQAALVRAGQDPKDAFSFGTVMSMYGVAQPFLNALREDQKARVRAEARTMGFGFAAAQI